MIDTSSINSKDAAYILIVKNDGSTQSLMAQGDSEDQTAALMFAEERLTGELNYRINNLLERSELVA